MNRLPIDLLRVAITMALAGSTTVAAEATKPNIIVILADDLGYGSLGCCGAPNNLKTPNLDRLAKEGRRFTQAYAPGSVCSPTRYGLMAGRYYWRTSIKDGEVIDGNAPLHLETKRLTLASLCKGQGYATAAVGKWHLGLGNAKRTDWNQPLTPGPLSVGFDYFFGMAQNMGASPKAYVENESLVDRVDGKLVTIEGTAKEAKTFGIDPLRKDDEAMRKTTEKAVGWIDKNRDRPFFLYFAPNAIHEPVTPAPQFAGSPFGKYGDFIEELDWSVGQVLAALDKHKIADNTLVVFSSDNGGIVAVNNEHAATALKAGLAINGKLRGGKTNIWEGGFREPFLVRWPGEVPANTVSDQVICLTDMVATLASILKAPLPDGPHAEDSVDVSRAFFEEKPGTPVRGHVILQDAHATYAIRVGDWKLIERENPPAFEPRNKAAAQKLDLAKKKGPKKDELFNLADDPGETKDMHADNPEVVARLRKLLAESREQGRTR